MGSTEKASHFAHRFTRACLLKNPSLCQLKQVFFVGLLSAPQPGTKQSLEWLDLKLKFGLDLVMIQTSLQNSDSTPILAPGIRTGGLGQLLEAILLHDRVIQF